MKSFTLAEVLIVIGIIGLIADMTIPTLHQNIELKVNTARLQKVYSTLENAYRLSVAENGTPDDWNLIGAADGTGAANLLSKFEPYLNIAQNCKKSYECWFAEKYLDGSSASPSKNPDDPVRNASFVLSDGTSILATIHSPNCTGYNGETKMLKSVCGSLDVDINGRKKPNQMGRDIFTFWLTKYGIVPLGTPSELINSFANTCKNRTSQKGFGCAAWVLYKGNMDYLTCQGTQCDDLKW